MVNQTGTLLYSRRVFSLLHQTFSMFITFTRSLSNTVIVHLTPFICTCVLRVEGENTLVVSSDQQQRRDVSGQGFQPAHVEGARHRAFPGQGQTPVYGQVSRVLLQESHSSMTFLLIITIPTINPLRHKCSNSVCASIVYSSSSQDICYLYVEMLPLLNH